MKARTIIALLTLLLAGGAAAWKFIPHTLSHDECSDVYRHFADMRLEGVRITYVQDKVINDTLRLPVTLLKAETDEGWEAFLRCRSVSIPTVPIVRHPKRKSN